MQVISCVAILRQKNDSNCEFIEGYSKRLKFPFPIDKYYSKSCFGPILSRTIALRELVVKSSNTEVHRVPLWIHGEWRRQSTNAILNYTRTEKDPEQVHYNDIYTFYNGQMYFPLPVKNVIKFFSWVWTLYVKFLPAANFYDWIAKPWKQHLGWKCWQLHS